MKMRLFNPIFMWGLEFFDEETFDCYQVFQNSGLIEFMSLKLPYYPELV